MNLSTRNTQGSEYFGFGVKEPRPGDNLPQGSQRTSHGLRNCPRSPLQGAARPLCPQPLCPPLSCPRVGESAMQLGWVGPGPFGHHLLAHQSPTSETMKTDSQTLGHPDAVGLPLPLSPPTDVSGALVSDTHGACTSELYDLDKFSTASVKTCCCTALTEQRGIK